jgi:hypothetical protein
MNALLQGCSRRKLLQFRYVYTAHTVVLLPSLAAQPVSAQPALEMNAPKSLITEMNALIAL